MASNRSLAVLAFLMFCGMSYFARHQIIYIAFPFFVQKEISESVFNPSAWACDFNLQRIQKQSDEDRRKTLTGLLGLLAMSDQDFKTRVMQKSIPQEMIRFELKDEQLQEKEQVHTVEKCLRDSLLLYREQAEVVLNSLFHRFPQFSSLPTEDKTEWQGFLESLCEKNKKCADFLSLRVRQNITASELSLAYRLLKTSLGQGLDPFLKIAARLPVHEFFIPQSSSTLNSHVLAIREVIRSAIIVNEPGSLDSLINFVNDSILPLSLRYQFYFEVPEIDREKARTFLNELATSKTVPKSIQSEALSYIRKKSESSTITYAEFEKIQKDLLEGFRANRFHIREDFRKSMERFLSSEFAIGSSENGEQDRKKAANTFVSLFSLANRKFGPNSNEIQQLLIVARKMGSGLNVEELSKPLLQRKESFTLGYQLIYQVKISPETERLMILTFKNFSYDEKKSFLLTCLTNRTHGKHFLTVLPELDMNQIVDIKSYWDGNPTQVLQSLEEMALSATQPLESNLKIWAAAYFMTNNSKVGDRLFAAAQAAQGCGYSTRVLMFRLWSLGNLNFDLPGVKNLLRCISYSDIDRLRFKVIKQRDLDLLRKLISSKDASPDQMIKAKKILQFSTT